ncbi:MAG TPA: NAD-dependent epimerase/dehydratase family protein [Devosiaceae bacterium]
MRYFVTGSSGFIGFHLVRRLLADGHAVVGYDGMTPYYDVNLKRQRLALLQQSQGFTHIEGMLEDKALLARSVGAAEPEIVVHLAAQAGVRYSIDHPETYADSNLIGTFNILELMRELKPRHLLLASSSSVYGGNTRQPFAETDRTDYPVSLYAATKKAGEAMAHAYAHIWNIPTTCFRFFTVYGAWGRPDMALFKFVEAIERGEPIEVFGEGQMHRDCTAVGDLVEAIVRLADASPVAGRPMSGVEDSLSPVAPWRSVNIAGGRSVGLLEFIAAIERALGKSANKTMLPMQAGDVGETLASPALLKALVGFVPETGVDAIVRDFVDWYRGWRAARVHVS